MKTIKCKVRCNYWDRSEEFEIVVDDDATEEQIEDEMKNEAANAAGFEFYRMDR